MNEFGNGWVDTVVGRTVCPVRLAQGSRRNLYAARVARINRMAVTDTKRAALYAALDAEFADVVAELGANR